MSDTDMIELARRFVGAIERGDVDDGARVLSPRRPKVWHNNDGIEQTVDDNLRVLGWMAKVLPEPPLPGDPTRGAARRLRAAARARSAAARRRHVVARRVRDRSGGRWPHRPTRRVPRLGPGGDAHGGTVVTTRLEQMRQVMASWAAGDLDGGARPAWPTTSCGTTPRPPTRPYAARRRRARCSAACSPRCATWCGRCSHPAETDDRLFLEGVDSYTAANGARIATPYMGVIDFDGDLITGWRDYVDLGVAAAQREGATNTAHVQELLDRPAIARAG